MNTVKNTIIASTLALAGLFSASANAGTMPAEQVIAKSDTILAKAMQSSNKVFAQCVDENFVLSSPKDAPPLLQDFYGKMSQAIAYGLVDDDVTFAIAANDLLKQVCGDSQMAGGGKKSK